MGDAAPIAAAGKASSADRPITAAGALAALGIVYGDLGTSPLYTYQAIVGRPSAAIPPHRTGWVCSRW